MGEREWAIRELLGRCARAYGENNVRDTRFNTEDRGAGDDLTRKEYSMCYDARHPSQRKLCGPDWCFVHWPSAGIATFERARDDVLRASELPPERPGVAGWLGNLHSPLGDVPEHRTRPLMKAISDEHPDVLEVVHVPPSELRPDGAGYMTLDGLVRRYGILIDIGGNGYSGRLKWLLFSRRPLLIVERNYVEFFHADLVPFEHFVPVREDLSDLLEHIAWVRDNPTDAQRIADNALSFALDAFSEPRLLERVLRVHGTLSS